MFVPTTNTMEKIWFKDFPRYFLLPSQYYLDLLEVFTTFLEVFGSKWCLVGSLFYVNISMKTWKRVCLKHSIQTLLCFYKKHSLSQ